MRKFLTGLAVAVALMAFGAVNNTAKAQAAAEALPIATGGGVAMFAGTSLGIAYLVYRDITRDRGLQRAMVPVEPGAGYQRIDYARAAQQTHEFNVAMGYADDADTAKYLAAASR